MRPRFDTPSDLPGQQLVKWRGSPVPVALAAALGAAWPPLILTLPVWPPQDWVPGITMDWRLQVFGLGLIAVPAMLWALSRERDRTGRPATRLGIVWRFMFYGGLLSAGVQIIMALAMAIAGGLGSAGVGEAAGFAETVFLIFGVGGLPIAMIVGVSYALWAGLCAAFIAFEAKPAPVRDRLGVIGETDGA